MQEKPLSSSSSTSRMNIVTAVCLGVFIAFASFLLFSTGYDSGPSIAWRIISDGLQSGVMDVNGGPLFGCIISPFFLIVGLLSFLALRQSLVTYRRKDPYAKKSAIVWASVLFGIILLVFACLLYVSGPSCIDDGGNGNTNCSVPIRPGIVIPTPVPYR